MSNKSDGNRFENELAEKFSDNGFWVHLFQQNKSGQPCDMIVSKNGRAAIIDCKVCKNDRFVFSRVEENQRYSMEKWLKTGNQGTVFALETSKGIFMLNYFIIRELEKQQKSFNMEEIEKFSHSFDNFIRRLW